MLSVSKEWKGSDGAFVPTEATKIVYAANNPELERIARILHNPVSMKAG